MGTMTTLNYFVGNLIGKHCFCVFVTIAVQLRVLRYLKYIN